jgi:hypothetical protein
LSQKKDIDEYKNIVKCIISDLVAREIAYEKDFNILPELFIEINIINNSGKKLNSGLVIYNDDMHENHDTYSIIIIIYCS